MQSNAEARVGVGQLDRLVGGRFVDHEARAGEDTLLVGLDDRQVDGMGAPKIVRVDDQPAGRVRSERHNWRRMRRW